MFSLSRASVSHCRDLLIMDIRKHYELLGNSTRFVTDESELGYKHDMMADISLRKERFSMFFLRFCPPFMTRVCAD